MSCKYCEYPSEQAISTNKKTDDAEDYSIEYDAKTDTFSMFTWNRYNNEIHKTGDVKYCPFCGSKLIKPNKKTVENWKDYYEEWEERQREHRKEQAKKEKEHQKWLEREYKKNPYDPTKPRLKDKNFRNAVKYLAKYMGVEWFYWDDDMRRLTGHDAGGYIDLEKKTIGPCYETNGVMESFHDSGKYYSVEELCYGYKNEK